MVAIGDCVVHPSIPGIASVQGIDADYITLKYGAKDVRRLSQKHPVTSLIRKATEEEIEKAQSFILWTDPDTGTPTRLDKRFLEVIRYLSVGRDGAITTVELLDLMGTPDTDTHRRQVRGAIDYYISQHSIAICASNGGYFIADTHSEVWDAVSEKMEKAENLQKSAQRLNSLDIEASKRSHRNFLTA